MNTHYKTITIIFFFLFTLSVGISLSNYYVSLKATQMQIKTQAMPLSVDNIYTAIQKNIIEPSIIASMMSHDTFVIEWLEQGETERYKIEHYLENIKNKYATLVAFLVSDTTQNYYTHEGVLKQIKKTQEEDAWYYQFKNRSQNYEINLDWNQHISKNMIMFINYKIFDANYHFLGATGVGIQISYIHEMLQMFEENYKLHVTFVRDDGSILLSREPEYQQVSNIYQTQALQKFAGKLLSKSSKMIEYEKNGAMYIMTSKYIPELDTYILVEANLDDFTHSTKNVFYFNLGISLLLTFIIAFILIVLIRGFQKKLEDLAGFDTLTGILNRRSLMQKLQNMMQLSARNEQAISLLFIDLDNFKEINDTLGHATGDLVLQHFVNVVQKNLRKTDLFGRWGGEEFIIAFVDVNAQNALLLANILRDKIAHESLLTSLINHPLTISAGLTQMQKDESIDSLISRADNAMYIAKGNGKDRVHLLNG